MKRAVLTVITLTALAVSGCASNKPGKRTAIGAGAGAAAGAGVGAVAGGWKGAAIGAGVGAAAGAGVGYYLDRQAEELKKVAETKRTENGILVSLKNDILFETNKAQLKPEALTQLEQVGDILAKYPEDRIKIEGYTDSRGTYAYNEALSSRRAEAVKNVLESRGVQEAQMLVLGRGEEEPVASNQTPQGRAKNRRVELHIDVPEQRASR